MVLPFRILFKFTLAIFSLMVLNAKKEQDIQLHEKESINQDNTGLISQSSITKNIEPLVLLHIPPNGDIDKPVTMGIKELLYSRILAAKSSASSDSNDSKGSKKPKHKATSTKRHKKKKKHHKKHHKATKDDDAAVVTSGNDTTTKEIPQAVKLLEKEILNEMKNNSLDSLTSEKAKEIDKVLLEEIQDATIKHHKDKENQQNKEDKKESGDDDSKQKDDDNSDSDSDTTKSHHKGKKKHKNKSDKNSLSSDEKKDTTKKDDDDDDKEDSDDTKADKDDEEKDKIDDDDKDGKKVGKKTPKKHHRRHKGKRGHKADKDEDKEGDKDEDKEDNKPKDSDSLISSTTSDNTPKVEEKSSQQDKDKQEIGIQSEKLGPNGSKSLLDEDVSSIKKEELMAMKPNETSKTSNSKLDFMLHIIFIGLIVAIVWMGINRIHECRKPREDKNAKAKFNNDDEESIALESKSRNNIHEDFDNFDDDN